MAGVFAWLSARAVPGVEVGHPDRYARTLTCPAGLGWFAAQADTGGITIGLSTLADLPPLVARVRRLFDLDADPVGIDDARARAGARTSGSGGAGIRLPGAVDPHEMLIRALIGQQISVAAARTQLTRLAEASAVSLPAPTPTD